VERDSQTRIQTAATRAFLQPLAAGDVQFSKWTLADERGVLRRARRDSHRADQVEKHARDDLVGVYGNVRVDWLLENLSRRASHDGRDSGFRSGVDLDPGGEV